ncbi:MAG: hypothetical protein ACQEP1_01715 [Nanobdellota archaeon]
MKRSILLIGFYIIVFFLLFAVFRGFVTEDMQEEDIDELKEDEGNITKEKNKTERSFWQKVKGYFSIEERLPQMCEFNEDFICNVYTPSRSNNAIQFFIENDKGERLFLRNITIRGNTTCSADLQEKIYPEQEFSVAVTGCNMTEGKAGIRLNYHFNERKDGILHTATGMINYKED